MRKFLLSKCASQDYPPFRVYFILNVSEDLVEVLEEIRVSNSIVNDFYRLDEQLKKHNITISQNKEDKNFFLSDSLQNGIEEIRQFLKNGKN